MEELQTVFHQNLSELGLESNEVYFHRSLRNRYVFSYPDSRGSIRVRKIIAGKDNDAENTEVSKALAWFSFTGLTDYFIMQEGAYDIIDTPFLGCNLRYLRRNYPIEEPYYTQSYLFPGFTFDYINHSLGILRRTLMEFREQTGLIQTDLAFGILPNNILWDPNEAYGRSLNVVDYEAFKPDNPMNREIFEKRWGVVVSYIMQDLVID